MWFQNYHSFIRCTSSFSPSASKITLKSFCKSKSTQAREMEIKGLQMRLTSLVDRFLCSNCVNRPRYDNLVSPILASTENVPLEPTHWYLLLYECVRNSIISPSSSWAWFRSCSLLQNLHISNTYARNQWHACLSQTSPVCKCCWSSPSRPEWCLSRQNIGEYGEGIGADYAIACPRQTVYAYHCICARSCR